MKGDIIRIRANKNPQGYLTPFKWYDVVGVIKAKMAGGDAYVSIIDDTGDTIFTTLNRSAHLNEGSWKKERAKE
jgi:hypothetical protein